jgi:hypothetical protein
MRCIINLEPIQRASFSIFFYLSQSVYGEKDRIQTILIWIKFYSQEYSTDIIVSLYGKTSENF